MATIPVIEGVRKWHRQYDNPKDDIVLITTQGTGFRVSSRLICKHSQWIKYQLEQPIIADEDVKPDLNPITVQTGLVDIALELFLDLITVNVQHLILSGLSYTHCRDLLSFSDHYQCNDITRKLRQQLPISAKYLGEPTALFLFASEWNDWSLGREALKKMNAKETLQLRDAQSIPPPPQKAGHKSTPKSKSKSKRAPPTQTKTQAKVQPDKGRDAPTKRFFESLSPEWRSVLMGLLMTRSYQMGVLTEDWSTIAAHFVQPRTPRRNDDGQPEGSKRAREE